MNRLKMLGVIVLVISVSMFIFQLVHATGGSVVISQIQLGNSSSATNEFVEIYNNTGSDVEVTNWCLYYASASSTSLGSKMVCFKPDSAAIHYFLPSRSYLFAVSNEYSSSNPGLGSDFKFSATLSGSAGHVRLVDNVGTEIDKIGWGTNAVSAEGSKPVATAPIGKVLSRKVASYNGLQDTDVNADDFEIILPRDKYLFGSVYEVQDLCSNISGIQSSVPDGYTVDDTGGCNPPPVDICPNIDGMQIAVPSGYGIDELGQCRIDVCLNIDGLQQNVPSGMDVDVDSNCVVHDECPNLPNIQALVPIGYVKKGVNCLLDLPRLEITEMLPNAIGSDDGNEYIELHNPNNSDIDLNNYVLSISSNSSKYSFPTGSHIAAQGYLAFYNSQIKFTLINSKSSVILKSADDQLIDQTDIYDSPAEGESWALIDGVWQYTNQPTPSGSNLASIIEDSIQTSTLKPCNVNQYRNLETGRCRILSSDGSSLTPCKDGQYRSEETNRCRSIADDANNLKPCAANQERNPDTNRCRNIAGTMPTADYAPEQTSEPVNNSVLWWSLAGVGLAAGAYGIWEWREEIRRFVQKTVRFLKRGK